jgi:hypothetical protein
MVAAVAEKGGKEDRRPEMVKYGGEGQRLVINACPKAPAPWVRVAR